MFRLGRSTPAKFYFSQAFFPFFHKKGKIREKLEKSVKMQNVAKRWLAVTFSSLKRPRKVDQGFVTRTFEN